MQSSTEAKSGSATATESAAPRRRSVNGLPSGAALAFLFPIVLLYWQVGGPSGLMADPSTGVHLRTGQWILAHHAVPRLDLFSFTMPNKRWIDWEWLSDLIFAEAYRLHGLAGVAALALLLLCLISVVVYLTARLHSGPIVAGATCALVMATSTIHWLARPHLFTWLGVSALFWALERHDLECRLWLVVVGMILWENLHPGFIAAFLVMSAWLAGAWLKSRFAGETEERDLCWREIKGYVVMLCVCGLATLANPYFFGLDHHIASYLLSPHTVTAHVSEWLSPDFHNPRLVWFELLLPVAASAGIWHAFRRRFHWCLLIFGSMHLALSSVRMVPLFAIICAAPLAAAGEEVLARFRFWQQAREAEAIASKASTGWATTGILALAVVGIATVSVLPVTLAEGSGIPAAAVHQLPEGRMFTTDQWADCLIYTSPGRKAFFDGRNDFYGPGFVSLYLKMMRAEPSWRQAFERYGITVAFLPRASALSAILGYSSGWRKLYRGADAVVFVRENPVARQSGTAK
jgi:hypothetical protein